MNKEIEYKTDNLKTTGEDITDLRKKIKVNIYFYDKFFQFNLPSKGSKK